VARICTICTHPQRENIDREIIAGESLRNLAKQYNVSYSAINRHKKHVPESLARAREAEEVSQADNLLAQVKELQDRATRILDKAEKSGDFSTALKAIREAKGCLELLAKLQGELQQEGTMNIHVNQQWVELRTVILEALGPYPEARYRLAEVLGKRHV
jgi:predicted DNA-binding protein YlxM (UPF0122 family)